MSLEVYYGMIIPNKMMKDHLNDDLVDELDFENSFKIIFHDNIDGCLLGISIYEDSFNVPSTDAVSFTKEETPTWDKFLASWNDCKFKELFADNFVPEEKEYKLHILTRE